MTEVQIIQALNNLQSSVNELNAKVSIMPSLTLGDESLNQIRAAKLLGISSYKFRKIASKFIDDKGGYSRLKILKYKNRV